MYNLIKKLLQNSAFYTFANSIEAFSPFILAIILTRLLTPGEYGIWVLFIALAAFVRPIVSLTIQDGLRMHFFEMDDTERADFVWSSLCLATLCMAGIVAPVLMFAAPLSKAVSFPAEWLVTIPIAAYLYATFYYLLAYNQFDHNRRRFLFLHLTQSAASLIFISLFVLSGWSWPGVIVGKMLGLAVGGLVGACWLIKSLDFNRAIRQRPHLRRLVKFGLMYLPTGMGLVAIPLTDRLIVTHILGLAQNGLYGVAALFGVAVFVAINGIIHAWMPWLFRSLGDWQSKSREILIVTALFLGILPLGGIIANYAVIPIAPVVIGEKFTAAFDLIPWAIAGAIAMGYFYHNQAFLHFKKAIVPMSISSLACIILNVVLSYYGAIHYGLAGVFAATIGAFLAAAAISAAFTLPRYQVPLVHV